jgi:hypothetical protein
MSLLLQLHPLVCTPADRVPTVSTDACLGKEEVKRVVEERIQARAVGRKNEGFETVWKDLKDCLLEVADKVCGITRGQPRHSQTWRWNDEVASGVLVKISKK